MSKHIEISVNINPICTEYAAEFLITELDCAGVVTQEIEYKHDEIIKNDIETVKGYIWADPESPLNIEEIQNKLWEQKEILKNNLLENIDPGTWNLSIKEIVDEEWANSWKKYWHTMRVSDRITIKPTWEEYEPSTAELVINLDPGIAFGTGTHQTTRLCVQAIEKYTKSGMTVADIGTGSGILSIAAAKMGAKEVIGVDNDKSVIPVATENADINNVGDICKFEEGTSEVVKGQYDLVVANILAHILIEIMDDLVRLMKNGSTLILSGIINEKAEDVRVAAVKAGLTILETTIEGDWSAVIAKLN